MSNNWSIEGLQEAWHFATRVHNGQKYGGVDSGDQVEYLDHIGSVVFEVFNTVNNNQKIKAGLALKCAVLHDTIEDTEVTYEILYSKFGRLIAEGVMALTKNSEIKDKKEKMLDSLKRIKKQSEEIWIVKMADRVVNLYSPPFFWNNKKKISYREESILIFNELKDASRYLSNRLKQKIEDYKKFID